MRELVHGLLHADNRPKTAAIAEVEVESVAYIVCGALGLDTSDYSFAYVPAGPVEATELVKRTASRVIECAKSILGCLVVASQDDEEVEKASSYHSS